MSGSGFGFLHIVGVNVVDHSGHSRGFPSKFFIFSFVRLVPTEYLLVYHKPALRFSVLVERTREFRYSEK